MLRGVRTTTTEGSFLTSEDGFVLMGFSCDKLVASIFRVTNCGGGYVGHAWR